jgi:hypothetical protein
VSPGDTYTSNDADLGGQTFTVYAKYKDKILVTPALWSTWRTGAGTLTKVSGSGDTTIPYTDTTFGENPLFYDQVDKPKGKYSQVAGNINGDFIISGSDVKKFMNYDKFHFLLYKAGGFALTDIYGTYHGNDDKLYVQKQVPKEIKGTELLAQTNVGDSEISAWTITGSVTPYATSDTGLPYSTTKVVDVSVNNKISQTLTYTKDVADKKIQIKVWARVFPSVFNPTSDISTAPITSDSFDLGTLGIELANPGQLSQEFTDIVGLHWKEILIDTVAPAQSSTMTITVYSKDKTIQIAKVSVKIES